MYVCVCPCRQPNPQFLHFFVDFPPSVMLLATFCNQVHSYLNQHPAAHFQIKSSRTHRCVIVRPGVNKKTLLGNCGNPALTTSTFHMCTFSVTEQHGRCFQIQATQGITTLHKLIFKLSTCHPEQLSALDAQHALPPFNLY